MKARGERTQFDSFNELIFELDAYVYDLMSPPGKRINLSGTHQHKRLLVLFNDSRTSVGEVIEMLDGYAAKHLKASQRET